MRELPGSVVTDNDNGGSDILGILESDTATEARSGAKTFAHALSSSKQARKNADDGRVSESFAATTDFFRNFVSKPPTVTEDHMDREYLCLGHTEFF